MNRRTFIPFFVLTLMAVWHLPGTTLQADVSLTPDNVVEVVVTGTGQVPFKGSEKASRLAALAQAKRDAVEKALGASVSVEMLPERRSIISRAEGGLRYDVLHEGAENGLFTISIRAKVPVPRDILDVYPLTEEERETHSGYPPLVEEFPDGIINWQEGYLLAYGEGTAGKDTPEDKRTLSARRAAIADGQAKALEIMAGIRVDARNHVKGLLSENEELSYRVNGTVRDGKVIEETQGEPYRITLKVPLTGVSGLGVVFYDTVAGEPKSKPPTAAPVRSPSLYTGLVIDARGTGLAPALFPRVVDTGGATVYSVETVDEGAFIKRGVAGYAVSDEEIDTSRVGSYPLVVRAAKIEGPQLALAGDILTLGQTLGSTLGPILGNFLIVQNEAGSVPRRRRQGVNPLRIKGVDSSGVLRANIVLSDSDARKLAGSPEFSDLLKQSRVIILTDTVIGGTEGHDLQKRPGGSLISEIRFR